MGEGNFKVEKVQRSARWCLYNQNNTRQGKETGWLSTDECGEKMVEKSERMGWRRKRDLWGSKPSNSSAGSFLELVSTRGKAASGTFEDRRKEMGFFHPPSRKWMNCKGERIMERWIRGHIWSWAEDSVAIELLAAPLHLMKKERISLCINAFYTQKLCCVNYTTVNKATQFSSAPGSSESLCCVTKMCLYPYTYLSFFWA